MVHDGHQAHIGIVVQFHETLVRFRMGHFAAQMDFVLGAGDAFLLAVGNGFEHGQQIGQAVAFGADVAHRQGVKHRGDA